jgi:protein TonB
VDFAESQRNPGKHPVGLIVVVVLHVVRGWALVNGLGKRIVDVVMKPVDTKLIEEVKPPPPPPPENLPPPPKNLPPPPAFVPPPEVSIAPQPNQAPTISTTNVAPPPQEVRISAAAPAVQAPVTPRAARGASLGDAACAPKPEDYPAAATRADATGTTTIRFTIDGTGKIVKSEVVKPSGPTREHRMLDRVALEKLSTCSFTPGTDENGHSVGSTTDVQYVWRLE